MGRLALRAAFERHGLTFTLINEVACDAAASAHLLEFDSVRGIWRGA
jgi:glyceraldehyde 3-phosphate dehydrogenase